MTEASRPARPAPDGDAPGDPTTRGDAEAGAGADARGDGDDGIELPGETDEERRERLRRAAYAAELATGRRERTGRQARRHIVARLAIIGAGSLVTVLGLLMLVLPGPGIVVVIAGLGILSTEVSWAERLLAYAKSKARLDQVTQQAPWVKPVAGVVTVVAVCVSTAYAIRWR